MKKLFMFITILLFSLSTLAVDRPIASVGEYLVFFDREGNKYYQPAPPDEQPEPIPESISIRIKKRPHNVFRNNWSGFELGYNGLYGENLDYFDLYWKSVNVRLNFIQKNIYILNNFGFYTGLGVSWDNYRFNTDKVLTSSPKGVIFIDNEIEYDKNKLTLSHLNVPLMVEIQTLNPQKFKRFYISGGLNVGYLMRSHTKQVIKNGGREKFKNYSDFDINSLRYDLSLRVGWGNFSFYGTYALNNMFKDEKGPDLTQYSFGIRLLNL